jgi:hypothetical protein
MLQACARDEIYSTGISSLQRSLLCELELKSEWYASPLARSLVELAPGLNATMHVFERGLGGVSTGVSDAVVLLPERVDRFDAASLAGQVASVVRADLIMVRVVGTVPLSASPQAKLRFALSDDGCRCKVVGEYRDVRQVLGLEATYAEFLASLGRSRRRNIENCRKDADRLGLRFHYVPGGEVADAAELSELARHNMPTPTRLRSLAGAQSLIARQRLPFHTRLTRDDGRLVSAAGGFIDGRFACLLYQYNHRADRDLSPSLMMRSMLIERLISQRVREIAFVGGCSGVLVHSCDRVRAADMLVVRTSAGGLVKHWLARKLDPKGRVARLSAGH